MLWQYFVMFLYYIFLLQKVLGIKKSNFSFFALVGSDMEYLNVNHV